MNILRLKLFVVVAMCGFAASAYAAHPCAPPRGAVVELKLIDGAYFVPATIGGKPRILNLNLDRKHSALSERLIAEMQLPTAPSPDSGTFLGGVYYPAPTATVPGVEFGGLTMAKVLFSSVSPEELLPGVDGTLARDFLDGYDFELDLGHNRLGLYAPADCDFVPYWPHAQMADLQFGVSRKGLFFMKMGMEGKAVRALVDTVSQQSAMDMMIAHLVYNIDGDDTRLSPAGKDDVGRSTYNYVFDEIYFGDVTVAHPKFKIVGSISDYCRDRSACACWTQLCEVYVGLDVLRQLRLLFVAREGRVYITPAEPAGAVPRS